MSHSFIATEDVEDQFVAFVDGNFDGIQLIPKGTTLDCKTKLGTNCTVTIRNKTYEGVSIKDHKGFAPHDGSPQVLQRNYMKSLNRISKFSGRKPSLNGIRSLFEPSEILPGPQGTYDFIAERDVEDQFVAFVDGKFDGITHIKKGTILHCKTRFGNDCTVAIGNKTYHGVSIKGSDGLHNGFVHQKGGRSRTRKQRSRRHRRHTRKH